MVHHEHTSRRRHSQAGSHRDHKSQDTDTFLRCLILCPVVFLTLLFGGARPWIWQGVTGFFFIALAAWHFRHDMIPPRSVSRAGLIGVLCLIFVPVLQAAPLPIALQGFLSPVRAVWTTGLKEFGTTFSTSLSYDPLTTWMHFAWWGFLIAFAWLLYRAIISRPEYPTWLLHALFLLAGFEAFYGILQTLIPSLGVLWDISPATGLAGKGYARGTFINRNHFAAFIGLLWPVLLGYLLILKTPRKMESILGKRQRAQELIQKKAFGVFCLGLVILGLVFSQSRGGILAALIAFTLLQVFAGLRQKRVAMALAGCWIVMLCYGGIIGFDDIVKRFMLTEEGAAGRMELWQDGWNAAMDHPLTGTGLGTYASVSRAYQNAIAPSKRAQHAHNDYLESVVEMGLPAASVLILGIWGLWWYRAAYLWRNRRTMNQDRLVLAAATLAALGGYLLHAWVEFNNAIPANQLTAVLVAVLHFSLTRQEEPQAAVRADAGHTARTDEPDLQELRERIREGA